MFLVFTDSISLLLRLLSFHPIPLTLLYSYPEYIDYLFPSLLLLILKSMAVLLYIEKVYASQLIAVICTLLLLNRLRFVMVYHKSSVKRHANKINN